MTVNRDTKAALAASIKAEQKKIRRRKSAGGESISRLAKPVKIKAVGKKKQKLELVLGAQDATLMQVLRDDCAELGYNVKRRTVLLLALRHLATAEKDTLKRLLESV